MRSLPNIMVAPNGARLKRDRHPAVPITIDEIIACGKACYDAGARAMHAHVRDDNAEHVLDAALYRALIDRMSAEVPNMAVQITTEAQGIYKVAEQRKLVREVMPQAASFALREMLSDNDETAARDFYRWAQAENVAIQHILYDPRELQQFLRLQERGLFGAPPYQFLFVLGRYNQGESTPQDLQAFLDVEGMDTDNLAGDLARDLDWAVCAFGIGESDCLRYAVQKGGKCRVGFENSVYHENGDIAEDNASRVRKIATLF